MQYYHLAKLLLAIYNPEIARPTAGLDYPRAHQQMEVSSGQSRGLTSYSGTVWLTTRNVSEECFIMQEGYVASHPLTTLPHPALHFAQSCWRVSENLSVAGFVHLRAIVQVEDGSQTPRNKQPSSICFLLLRKNTAGQPSMLWPRSGKLGRRMP